MEPRVWIFLVLILIVSSAQALIIADLYYTKKRVKKLEGLFDWQDERVYDLAESVDKPAKQRYASRRAARRLIDDIQKDD